MSDPTCLHCGAPKHTGSLCRAELSIKLAEEINERQQAAKDRGSLWVAVAELRDEVHSLKAEVRQL